jgi:hypothetical protein
MSSGYRRLTSRLLLSVFALLTACPYGDAWYKASGRIVDPGGLPVQGALFWIGSTDTGDVDRSRRVKTDSLGRFEYFEGTAPAEFQALIRVERQGFQPLRLEIPQSKAVRLTCIEILLAPIGADQKSRVTRADTTPSRGSCFPQ